MSEYRVWCEIVMSANSFRVRYVIVCKIPKFFYARVVSKNVFPAIVVFVNKSKTIVENLDASARALSTTIHHRRMLPKSIKRYYIKYVARARTYAFHGLRGICVQKYAYNGLKYKISYYNGPCGIHIYIYTSLAPV